MLFHLVLQQYHQVDCIISVLQTRIQDDNNDDDDNKTQQNLKCAGHYANHFFLFNAHNDLGVGTNYCYFQFTGKEIES